MRKSLKLSAIALLTTAMTALPVYALSLNLGGDGPLVDLGNDNNADATVSVDTGNVLGGDNGGSSGSDADAAIDVNLGSIGGGDDGGGSVDNGLIDLDSDADSLIDLGGDGDLLDLGGGGDLLDLGGSDGLVDLADIDLGDGNLLDLGNGGDLLDLGGPLLDLSGDAETDALIEADLGGGELLDLGETGGILDLGGSGDLLDLGGSGDLLDLGGGELLDLDSSEDVALDLGNTNVGVDLNTEGGDDPLAKVTITTDDDGVAGTGVLPGTTGTVTVGGDNAASVSLDTGGDGGNGNGGAGGNGGGAGNGNGGGAGNGNGGSGNGGNSGGNGAGGGAGGSGNGSGGNGSGGDFVAAANTGGDCMTLDAAQLEQLLQRHIYNRATFNSWAAAQQLKIVEVDFCDAAAVDVAAAADGSANVARLQAFLAAQAKVKAGLESKGHSAGDVIAADHSGNVLIVYVI